MVCKTEYKQLSLLYFQGFIPSEWFLLRARILTSICLLFAISLEYLKMMYFGKSKLLWIVMAAIMLLMLRQGFSDFNMMFVMIAVMAIVVMGLLMNKTRHNR